MLVGSATREDERLTIGNESSVSAVSKSEVTDLETAAQHSMAPTACESVCHNTRMCCSVVGTHLGLGKAEAVRGTAAVRCSSGA